MVGEGEMNAQSEFNSFVESLSGRSDGDAYFAAWDAEIPMTWRMCLFVAMKRHGEVVSDVLRSVGDDLDKIANDLPGKYQSEVIKFTVWTKDRVYFPAGYDSSLWVASVPRNPCDESVEYVGGGCL